MPLLPHSCPEPSSGSPTPTVTLTFPLVQIAVLKIPSAPFQGTPPSPGPHHTAWVLCSLSVARMLLLSAGIFCIRTRKNSRWFSPLLVKPPPGFSQDTAKEERNQYLGTLPKCPAFLMSDQRANEVRQTLWSPVLNVLSPLSLKQEPQISVSQLRESES